MKEGMMDFDSAFDTLLGHEGGFSDHPHDTGKQTMWGVTVAVARQHGYEGDMKDLPVSLAKAIYRKSYWDAVQAESLPSLLRYAVFDAGVNSGPVTAIRWLQEAVGATPDGILGPKTLAAVNELSSEGILRRLLAKRLTAMTSMSGWPSFSRGWARRIATLLEA